MDVSLRQVRSFLMLARVQSFTGAASILNVTQAALTMQIRRLEEALGVTLFDRDTRSVELTRIARDLLPAFERALQDFDARWAAHATSLRRRAVSSGWPRCRR
jgi:LysR family transcriptional regulator, carnitine catabolism transcriptional activator